MGLACIAAPLCSVEDVRVTELVLGCGEELVLAVACALLAMRAPPAVGGLAVGAVGMFVLSGVLCAPVVADLVASSRAARVLWDLQGAFSLAARGALFGTLAALAKDAPKRPPAVL